VDDDNNAMAALFRQNEKNHKAKMAMDQDLQFVKKVTKQVTGASANKINAIVSDSLDVKEDPLVALKREFEDTPMRFLSFYTRSSRTKIVDLVCKPTTTGVWKSFVKELSKRNGQPLSMAFHLHGQRSPWVVSNHITGYSPAPDEEIQGCITVYVRGDNMPVHIMRLDTYLKAIIT
jgi:hypothetical protein